MFCNLVFDGAALVYRPGFKRAKRLPSRPYRRANLSSDKVSPTLDLPPQILYLDFGQVLDLHHGASLLSSLLLPLEGYAPFSP